VEIHFLGETLLCNGLRKRGLSSDRRADRWAKPDRYARRRRARAACLANAMDIDRLAAEGMRFTNVA